MKQHRTEIKKNEDGDGDGVKLAIKRAIMKEKKALFEPLKTCFRNPILQEYRNTPQNKKKKTMVVKYNLQKFPLDLHFSQNNPDVLGRHLHC